MMMMFLSHSCHFFFSARYNVINETEEAWSEDASSGDALHAPIELIEFKNFFFHRT
jgi:hypothetical protein